VVACHVMATLVGTELSAALYERLRGADLPAVADQVIQLFTVDDDGWPHAAMLSYFEVVAVDPRNLRLAPYSSSATTRNMRKRGRATLGIMEARMIVYIKGTVTELASAMVCAPANAKLNLRIDQVLSDAPDPRFEPDAYLASGITYVNPHRGAALENGRRLIEELKT
jgi:Pyridoxamine 5'-phosphate oxidase